jgi:hypothetical protein
MIVTKLQAPSMKHKIPQFRQRIPFFVKRHKFACHRTASGSHMNKEGNANSRAKKTAIAAITGCGRANMIWMS